METLYKYDNRWGYTPALHALCSLLRNHRERTTFCACEIGYFLGYFADHHRANVLQAREAAKNAAEAKARGDEQAAAAWEQKKRELKTAAPYILPAAYYPQNHTADSPRTPSGVLCVDIDRKDNLHISAADWASLPADLQASKFGKYCAFIGESRSGWERGGYFVLVPITGADDYPQRFAAVARWMEGAGVKIDMAAKNMNHGRALTLQDNSTRTGFCSLPIVNPAAEPYGAKYFEPRPERKPAAACVGSKRSEYERARRAAAYIARNGVQISDDFTEWTRLALAFATEFGEAGEALFLQVAEVSPKFRSRENDYKWKNAKQTASGRVGIATFWYLCKRAGLDIKSF